MNAWRSGLVPQLAAPLLIVLILAMMLVPLPPLALDLMFSFNIAISLVVLIVASYTRRTLDFASFPSVLLVTTLLRLALNVASTRAVLLHGHTGTGAAGQVIESFAHFLIGGSFAVGLVVFSILTVINFVVVTKAPAASPRCRPASRWTRCPASRWPSTPTWPPAPSTTRRPASAATR